MKSLTNLSNWQTVKDVITAYPANVSMQKAEIIQLVRSNTLKPVLNQIDEQWQVSVDGFVLETFRTHAAACFYLKNLGIVDVE